MSVIDSAATWGGDVGSVLQSWADAGIFSYVLPFLLIFALIFAILSRIKFFEDKKTINMIISLAAALMALQFGYVPAFFEKIFPKMGVGLAVLLVALIFFGAFIDWGDNKKAIPWTFLGIGALIFLIVVLQSFTDYSVFGAWWWQEYWQGIITLVVIAAVIILVVATGNKRSSSGSGG